MDVNYINPFIESVVHVFKTALGCDIERKNLYLKDTAVPSHEVSGIIGLSGNASGVVVLSVSRQIAFQVVKTMLDMDVREVNGDVVDAVGELTNMVAGAAKAQLAQYEMSLGLPSVVAGRNHCVSFPSNVKPICLVFDTPWGAMTLEVGLDLSECGAASRYAQPAAAAS